MVPSRFYTRVTWAVCVCQDGNNSLKRPGSGVQSQLTHNYQRYIHFSRVPRRGILPLPTRLEDVTNQLVNRCFFTPLARHAKKLPSWCHFSYSILAFLVTASPWDVEYFRLILFCWFYSLGSKDMQWWTCMCNLAFPSCHQEPNIHCYQIPRNECLMCVLVNLM